ncbi:hypothetical protein PsYK624_170610 [Phanerochaete sordida]|uniref:Uncharacterized protein n=1 Tax=Phanerochaete sordida TaxID=48140 RepID=A0A9P3GYN4_9APHY|nr:hypothetical protein PsYK624_170610 [Phanerochaete sordida]
MQPSKRSKPENEPAAEDSVPKRRRFTRSNGAANETGPVPDVDDIDEAQMPVGQNDDADDNGGGETETEKSSTAPPSPSDKAAGSDHEIPSRAATPADTSAPSAPPGLQTELSTDTRWYWDEDMVARLTPMTKYQNPDKSVYSVAVAPWEATKWGEPRNGFRADAELHVNGKRAVFWGVFEVAWNNMVSDEGLEHSPSIRFRPFLQRDFDILKHLVTNKAKPSKDGYQYDTFYASRFMAKKEKRREDLKPFPHIFNAVPPLKYTKKADMAHETVHGVKPGDIVLLEFTVKRYVPPASDAAASRAKERALAASGSNKQSTPRWVDRSFFQREWTVWDVGFNMEAVTLLYRGSDHYAGGNPDSEDVEL